jgi:thymidylate synthase ThyX
MAYKAEIILDSLAPSGFRLTTFVITYPRFVHSEFMTHRMFSRNAASSRAVPIEKMIAQVENDPVFPIWWGKAQSGMQAHEELEGYERVNVALDWQLAKSHAVHTAKSMHASGLHKQIANRILEPFSWITVIVTSNQSGLENFFALRCHPDAQPELRKIAEMMRDLYYEEVPEKHIVGGYHCPFVYDDDYVSNRVGGALSDELMRVPDLIKKISVARCARVSYLNHEGKRDIEADLKLFERLKTSGHWSAFEHVAMAADTPIQSGNFTGWVQYRKTFEHECRTYSFTP